MIMQLEKVFKTGGPSDPSAIPERTESILVSNPSQNSGRLNYPASTPRGKAKDKNCSSPRLVAGLLVSPRRPISGTG